MATELANLTIPLRPQSIQDLAWGLSLFFSANELEQKFGEDVKSKWDKLVERYNADDKAAKYLDNVNAVMSGAIYNLAQLRKQVNDHFKFLDSLKIRQMKDLDDLASLSKDAESIATRIAGISLGGGVSFIGSATNVFGTQGIVWFIIGAGITYFALEAFLRLYRSYRIPKIMKQTQKKKEEFLIKQFEKNSKEALEELLTKVNEIAEKIYGTRYAMSTKTITATSITSATVTSGSYLTAGTNIPEYDLHDSRYQPL